MSLATAIGWWLLLGIIAASVLASLISWSKHLSERDARRRFREIEGIPHGEKEA